MERNNKVLPFIQETLRLWNDEGQEHRIGVVFAASKFKVIIGAFYETGSLELDYGTPIIQWTASYEPPNSNDPGCVLIGEGRIDLNIPLLRGIGLGSLLMRPIVSWIKDHVESVPVAPITLSADDAKTFQARDIRNRFYEKLGFKFKYKDQDKSWGESTLLLSSNLIVPPFKLSRDWKVESIEVVSKIF